MCMCVCVCVYVGVCVFVCVCVYSFFQILMISHMSLQKLKVSHYRSKNNKQ